MRTSKLFSSQSILWDSHSSSALHSANALRQLEVSYFTLDGQINSERPLRKPSEVCQSGECLGENTNFRQIAKLSMFHKTAETAQLSTVILIWLCDLINLQDLTDILLLLLKARKRHFQRAARCQLSQKMSVCKNSTFRPRMHNHRIFRPVLQVKLPLPIVSSDHD